MSDTPLKTAALGVYGALSALLTAETVRIIKPSVANYSDMAITYPQPENGWTVKVVSENVSYRYNATTSKWYNIGNVPDVVNSEPVDLSGLIPITEKGAANGVATLGADGKIPSNQFDLPEAQISTLGVSPRQFGAGGAGLTDDTQAVQDAINYCLSLTTPLVGGASPIPNLLVDGYFKIRSTIKINRPENQTGIFRIAGFGVVGGFMTTDPITMFSTDYVGSVQNNHPTSQLSNMIRFENVQSTSTNPDAYVINANKFVRVDFYGCYWNGIKHTKSYGNDYVQSMTLERAFVRGVTGKFFDCYDAYDVHINGRFEACSDTVINVQHEAHGCNLGDDKTLVQNCYRFANIANGKGAKITAKYAEAITNHFAVIGVADGVSVKDCYIASTDTNGADPNYYEIVVGESIAFEGSGNKFSHRGYEFTGTQKNAVVGAGDKAGVQLIKDATGITNLANLPPGGGNGNASSFLVAPGATVTVDFTDSAQITTHRINDTSYKGLYIVNTNWGQVIPFFTASGVVITKVTGGATIKNNNSSDVQVFVTKI